MTDRAAFLDALEQGRQKLFDQEGAPRFPGWTRDIAYVFTDTGEHWAIHVRDGIPGPLVEGELDMPDVRFTMTSDTLIGLMDGSINGMLAFTSGRVKVRASMSDIRQLQSLV